MHPPPLWIDSELVLDARRAAWLPKERTLAVADLHLGYAWAQRAAGHLHPLSVPDETAARLLAIVADYQPRRVALLGDIVHRAVTAPALLDLLKALLAALEERAEVILLAGNHDRGLSGLLAGRGAGAKLTAERECGPHLLLHGEETDPRRAGAIVDRTAGRGGRVIIGHEHPAITLGDGVATSAKVPCFLLGPGLAVLPAFSPWAAGSEVRRRQWLSAFPRVAPPERAVAILGSKLLPLAF